MNKRKAFTLIELLVVIAIIAILISIQMPTLGKIRQRARVTVCKNQLHQWAVATQLYVNGNDGKYPNHAIGTTVGENPHGVSYLFVLQMHDDFKIPYKMFYCPAQPQKKYPGSDELAFQQIFHYSLDASNQAPNPPVMELGPNPHLATIGYSWWVPRNTVPTVWFPVRVGESTAVRPTKDCTPYGVTDKGQSTIPIMTDICKGNITNQPELEYVDYGGHFIGSRIDSVNSMYGDGHVEVTRREDLQMQYESRQQYHWW